jgi:hypothetical protein
LRGEGGGRSGVGSSAARLDNLGNRSGRCGLGNLDMGNGRQRDRGSRRGRGFLFVVLTAAKPTSMPSHARFRPHALQLPRS